MGRLRRSGVFPDKGKGSVKEEILLARMRLGSPMMPECWRRFGVTHMGGEELTCKGCGCSGGADVFHLFFECEANPTWVQERRELLHGYKSATGMWPSRSGDFMDPRPSPGCEFRPAVRKEVFRLVTNFVQKTLCAGGGTEVCGLCAEEDPEKARGGVAEREEWEEIEEIDGGGVVNTGRWSLDRCWASASWRKDRW